jgi:hypothetical protein
MHFSSGLRLLLQSISCGSGYEKNLWSSFLLGLLSQSYFWTDCCQKTLVIKNKLIPKPILFSISNSFILFSILRNLDKFSEYKIQKQFRVLGSVLYFQNTYNRQFYNSSRTTVRYHQSVGHSWQKT